MYLCTGWNLHPTFVCADKYSTNFKVVRVDRQKSRNILRFTVSCFLFLYSARPRRSIVNCVYSRGKLNCIFTSLHFYCCERLSFRLLIDWSRDLGMYHSSTNAALSKLKGFLLVDMRRYSVHLFECLLLGKPVRYLSGQLLHLHVLTSTALLLPVAQIFHAYKDTNEKKIM